MSKREQRYPITPMGAPRMTQRDKWKGRPVVRRYRAFRDACRLHCLHVPECGAHITFVMPMPLSWSKKKRSQHDGQPHQAKPDSDNMLKAVLDAIYGEDCGVWDVWITKRWGTEGQIIVSIDGK